MDIETLVHEASNQKEKNLAELEVTNKQFEVAQQSLHGSQVGTKYGLG